MSENGIRSFLTSNIQIPYQELKEILYIFGLPFNIVKFLSGVDWPVAKWLSPIL